VTLLLDTHAFLWFVWADPLLSTTAKSAVEDPANRKLVSVASAWEIAIKAGNGKLTLGAPATVFVPRELAKNNFDLLEITLTHATAVETLPQHHRDPFDRLLIVQTQIEGLTIVSVDTAFDAYGVTRIW
jgi:PIN domain nuclease of toxin-antitoxin system